jgi:conjugative transfer signal peptidase TraF
VVLAVLVILNFTHVIYFNIFTHSLPYGIYIKTKGTPQRGDYAASCLTTEIARYGIDRGYLIPGHCDTGTVMVLKIIAGLPGDHFMVQDGSLELNGKRYPIRDKDSSGRGLRTFYQRKAGALGRGEYILISTFAKNSWDSRYWGPQAVQFLLKPLWIFEK